MKAVNLIPPGESTGGSRSGGAVYGLLAALGVLVALTAVYVLAGRSVTERRAELAAVSAQTQATEAKAEALKPFAEFADTRKARVETVKNLIDSRFDWAASLREVARTMPSGTWLTSLRATVNPNVAVDGSPDPLRGAIAAPAIEAAGCAKSQAGVAELLVSLRAMAGVQRVTLSNSSRASDDGQGTSDSAQSSRGGCGTGPQFSLTIFFEAKAASATAAAGGTTP